MPYAVANARGVVMVDVAKRAGVSQKTVSRVVNNAPHVRPGVRDRVMTAIAELGYHPNVAAQALARNRTHVIGMLAIASDLYGPARRVFTIEQATRRHGFRLALASLPDLERDTVAAGVQDLLGSGVEGIVVEVPNHLVDLDLGRLDLPVVTSAGRIAGVARQAVIDTDQADAARQATNYLLGLGHETVWHLAGPRDWDAARKRLTGWRAALRDAGRRVPPVFYGDWSARAGYQRGLELARRDDVTAVFAANDHMAMGLLRAIAETGRRIPEDISVMGYDNVPEAEFQMVPLTTVGSDESGTAERMLSELVALIEGDEPPEAEIDLGFSLIFRRSSGPPPSR
ncbi:LacI family DNA-binding transcriptional regulator [Microlunatus ginsengisoli]|uniref:LacI family DNA-binding transcriptional regulator n=1 Tax=Microlunatus ginsengisoli TaxID=363863 RepID=A0ABP7ANN8_9ACTN